MQEQTRLKLFFIRKPLLWFPYPQLTHLVLSSPGREGLLRRGMGGDAEQTGWPSNWQSKKLLKGPFRHGRN